MKQKAAKVKPNIHVIIVYDSESIDCDTHCGMDWSSTETIALIKQRIKERFGDSVTAEYLDQSKPDAEHRAVEIKQATGSENLTLPLLVIDGQPRISGKFDVHLLLDAVDTEIEIKQDKE